MREERFDADDDLAVRLEVDVSARHLADALPELGLLSLDGLTRLAARLAVALQSLLPVKLVLAKEVKVVWAQK